MVVDRYIEVADAFAGDVDTLESVGGEIDLGGQSAAGASEGMVGRLAGRGPFWRAPAAR
ncbi:hypothetical protein ACFWUZ_17550 [Streptomyces sp. NPDC058646]|uniref:hypothetical protein n=1 Tax=Streptomyces sp. NPDC058646 TaxID=3346574 RepID=UPI00365C83D9